jgi:hypothetical protein
MAAKARVQVKAFPGIYRFRGRRSYSGGHIQRSWHIHGGIYKGPSPCSCATRPSRRGPSAREAAMGRSYRGGHIQRRWHIRGSRAAFRPGIHAYGVPSLWWKRQRPSSSAATRSSSG